MSLIDKTYFKGLVRLQTGNNIISDLLDEFIPRIEKDILVRGMGYSLYSEFKTQIEANSPEQKWLDLRDGKEFTLQDFRGNEITVYFPGLANSDNENMLAYFTYFYVVRMLQQQATSAGVTYNVPEAGGLTNAGQKMADAWNNGVRMYGHDIWRKFLYDWTDVISTYITRDIVEPSLYNFIYWQNYYNGEDYYPDWQFQNTGYITSLGI